jgi:membrane protein DedA with SNARE-associated domain
MTNWLGHLAALAMQASSNVGGPTLIALLAVALLTELGIPFPGVMDSVLFLIGYRLVHPWLPAVLIVLSFWVGRQLGSGAVFWLARKLSEPFRNRLGSRASLEAIGRSLGNGRSRKGAVFTLLGRLGSQISRASTLNFGARVPLGIILGRITPGLLTACSVACGVMGVRYHYFVAGIALSSLVADGVLVTFGVTASLALKFFGVVLPTALLVIIAIVVNIALILMLGRWLLRRQRIKAPHTF